MSGAAQSKLSKRFYGPFRISARMGPVAYKLELPEHSRIHPVFHCSPLKPFIGPLDTVQIEKLPPGAVDNQPVPIPLAILGHKTLSTNHGPKQLVLVQWQGLHPDETSWEDWSRFRSFITLRTRCCLKHAGMLQVAIMSHKLPGSTQITARS